jgi:hypothetical protein
MLLHRRHLGYLHPGEYFGEYSCLLGQERSATVVASGYVELYSLSRSDLELVLQQWPELAEQFESMGEWTSWWHQQRCLPRLHVTDSSCYLLGTVYKASGGKGYQVEVLLVLKPGLVVSAQGCTVWLSGCSGGGSRQLVPRPACVQPSCSLEYRQGGVHSAGQRGHAASQHTAGGARNGAPATPQRRSRCWRTAGQGV